MYTYFKTTFSSYIAVVNNEAILSITVRRGKTGHYRERQQNSIGEDVLHNENSRQSRQQK